MKLRDNSKDDEEISIEEFKHWLWHGGKGYRPNESKLMSMGDY